MSRRKKFVGAGIAGLALVLALTGCTNQAGNFSGIPDHVDQTGGSADDGLQVFWVGEGARIAISIWGSSTCPEISTQLKVIATKGEGNTVEAVVTAIPDDQPCTRDFVPHTSTFWTPSSVSTTEPLVVIVGDQKVTLPVK